MEHPHDPYHVRPFPQQPHRGGKALLTALDDLEAALTESIPHLAQLRKIQANIHEVANHFNDDRLVDMIRQMTTALEQYEQKPSRTLREKIITTLLKIRIALKHP